MRRLHIYSFVTSWVHSPFLGIEKNAAPASKTQEPSELNAARDFLRQADMLVAGVRSLFLNMGDSTAAARLKGIEGRLQDEVQVLERLIAKETPNGGQA